MGLILWFLKLFPVDALAQALANKKGIVSVSMVTERDLIEMAKQMSQHLIATNGIMESLKENLPQPDLRPSDGSTKFH